MFSQSDSLVGARGEEPSTSLPPLMHDVILAAIRIRASAEKPGQEFEVGGPLRQLAPLHSLGDLDDRPVRRRGDSDLASLSAPRSRSGSPPRSGGPSSHPAGGRDLTMIRRSARAPPSRGAAPPRLHHGPRGDRSGQGCRPPAAPAPPPLGDRQRLAGDRDGIGEDLGAGPHLQVVHPSEAAMELAMQFDSELQPALPQEIGRGAVRTRGREQRDKLLRGGVSHPGALPEREGGPL